MVPIVDFVSFSAYATHSFKASCAHVICCVAGEIPQLQNQYMQSLGQEQIYYHESGNQTRSAEPELVTV